MSPASPKFLLHGEGGIVLLGAIVAYHKLMLTWWVFAALFLAPDLCMLGYLGGPRLGAILYNVAHTYVVPVLLGIAAHLLHSPSGLMVAVVWVAHIGFDRLLGFGLKYSAGFQHTHFDRL